MRSEAQIKAEKNYYAHIRNNEVFKKRTSKYSSIQYLKKRYDKEIKEINAREMAIRFAKYIGINDGGMQLIEARSNNTFTEDLVIMDAKLVDFESIFSGFKPSKLKGIDAFEFFKKEIWYRYYEKKPLLTAEEKRERQHKQQKNWREANKDKIKANAAKYRKNNPDAVKESRNKYNKPIPGYYGYRAWEPEEDNIIKTWEGSIEELAIKLKRSISSVSNRKQRLAHELV